MAIEPVKKVYLLGYQEIESLLVSSLQELGIVEVGQLLPGVGFPEPGAEVPEERELESALGRLEHVMTLLGRFAPPRSMLAGGGQKVALSRAEFRGIIEGRDLEDLAKRCTELEQLLGDFKAKRSALEAAKSALAPWHDLQVPLRRFRELGIGFRLGQVPLNRYGGFRAALADFSEELSIHEVNTDGKAKYLAILFPREREDDVETVCKEYELSSLEYAEEGLTPREYALRVEEMLHRLHEEEEAVHRELAGLYPRRASMLALHDHYASLLAGERVRQRLARTESSFCLTGWIPAREALRAREILLERFPTLEIIYADPEETDTVPVILENRPVVRPFEVITDLYGRPVYRGVDPTPYLSAFFAAFFGFCLTDAGYGLVLMLLTGLLLWKARPHLAVSRRHFYQLFFLCGAATVVLGAVVGTWFGVTVSWKLFDALEDLMVFFGLALALGVLHLLTGLGIKMARSIRAGDWVSGICDQGLWMLIMVSLIAFGFGKAGLLPGGLYRLTQILSLGSALGIVFFQGRQADRTVQGAGRWSRFLYTVLWLLLTGDLTLYLLGMFRPASGYMALSAAAAILVVGIRRLKGILARIGLGLYSLYGISGYLGDTLSYSRLVALGLTTGIVGMIINKMAGIAQGAPYVGWLLALLILIAGHAFNIVINLLGAFVHSCRLQYVEFFTKFYEPGGRPFKPFRFEHKYTMLND